MNPELENALFAYYRKRRWPGILTIVIASCCLLPALFGALPVDARPIASLELLRTQMASADAQLGRP